jgi:hypothetical protein
VRRAELRNPQRIKMAGGLVASISRLDATIDFVQVDDVWLPRRSQSSVTGRILLLKGLRQHRTEEFRNYRRFGVTTEEQIARPARPAPD